MKEFLRRIAVLPCHDEPVIAEQQDIRFVRQFFFDSFGERQPRMNI
jgi:hypothetical protein